jgi:HlyD family secretion protein
MTQANGSRTNTLDTIPPVTTIRIVIVDALEVICQGLGMMLSAETDFEVVGTSNDGRNAIALIAQVQPDVVLIGVELPTLDGIRATKMISEQFPHIKVLILSNSPESHYLAQALEAGAKGFFLKQMPVAEVKAAIRSIAKGYCQFGPGLLETAIHQATQGRGKGRHLPPSGFTPVSDPDFPSDWEFTPDPHPPSLFTQTPWWSRKLLWLVVGLAIVGLGAWAILKLKPELAVSELPQLSNPLASSSAAETPVTANPTPNTVAALGRIEPQGEIIRLSVSSAAEGARVEELFIEQGDKVQRGQIIAVLDSYSVSLAALETAKADVQTAQANLARVEAGAKAGDINAQEAAVNRLEAELRGQVASQRAAIARLQAELENAQIEYRRYENLYQDGAISASERDTRRLRVDTVRQELAEAQETLNRTIETTQVQRQEARARLDSVAEVRPVDLQVARAELEQAQAAVQQAQAKLNLTYIRAPVEGQILKIHTRAGEVVGNDGVVEIGQTNQMYVLAQVYETDIERVEVGQSATITGNAFSGKLQGEVAQIGLQVNSQDVFEVNPLADTDNRVIEVKIRLTPESSQQVSHLSNLQVQTVIHPK